MKKLLAKLSGGHRPDIEALSAHIDGRLDQAAARSLEAHLAACEACAARLAALHHVRTTLAALPRAETPRSFRLRQAQVEAPARAARGGGGWFGNPAFAPAAAATLVMAFALILGTDLATRGDDGAGSGGTLASMAADEAARNSETYDAPAAGMVPPEAGEVAPDTGAAEPAPIDTAAGDDGDAAAGAQTTTAAPGKELENLSRAMDEGGDDDGGSMAFLVAEVVVGAAALAAVGWFVASRGRQSEEV